MRERNETMASNSVQPSTAHLGRYQIHSCIGEQVRLILSMWITNSNILVPLKGVV